MDAHEKGDANDLTLVDDYGDTLNVDAGTYKGQPRVYMVIYEGHPDNESSRWEIALSVYQARQVRDYLTKALLNEGDYAI